MRTVCLVFSILCVFSARVNATPFRNLDFEQANVVWPGPNNTFIQVDPAMAFPGWTVNRGAPSNHIFTLLDSTTLGASAQTLFDDNPSSWLSIFPPIQGRYSVLLYVDLPQLGIPELKQIGTIPADARSVSFAAPRSESRRARVLIDGQALPLFTLPNNRIGADVSIYAGRDVELAFSTTIPVPNGPGNFALFFDDIQFSPVPVPEPSTIILLTAGFLVIAIRRRAFD